HEEAGVLLAELEQHLARPDATALADTGDATDLSRRQLGEHLVAAAQVRVCHRGLRRAGSRHDGSVTIHPRVADRRTPLPWPQSQLAAAPPALPRSACRLNARGGADVPSTPRRRLQAELAGPARDRADCAENSRGTR